MAVPATVQQSKRGKVARFMVLIWGSFGDRGAGSRLDAGSRDSVTLGKIVAAGRGEAVSKATQPRRLGRCEKRSADDEGQRAALGDDRNG